MCEIRCHSADIGLPAEVAGRDGNMMGELGLPERRHRRFERFKLTGGLCVGNGARVKRFGALFLEEFHRIGRPARSAGEIGRKVGGQPEGFCGRRRNGSDREHAPS